MAKPTPTKKHSLVEFMLAKRRAGCRVCALSEDIREQLRAAASKAIRRADQIAWLAAEYKITVTRADFDAHFSGRHEVGDGK